MENEKKQNGRWCKLTIMIIAIVLAAVILTVGIVLPIVLKDEFTNDEGVNPYAEIELSNGMTLTFDIWEKDCPIAATNFIYLAEEGYFDGTVIFDKSAGWVRFGGYKADGTHKGDEDTDFLAKYDDRVTVDYDYSQNKFGYRLRKDTAKSDMYDTMGVLSFCYERSATEFQIVADDTVSLTVDGGGEWNVSPFAMATTETIAKLEKLYALASDQSGKFAHPYFSAPLDGDNLITIKSVKITKKNRDKWEHFDFMDYYKGDQSSTRLYTWRATAKKTGEK